MTSELPQYQTLWRRVISERATPMFGIHGPQHWARVERNGLFLAEESGADVQVVAMFALFHDSCRENDGHDPEHGLRGARYATTLREELAFLDDEAFEKLVFACTWHTDRHHHDDPTIHTCFDADRLDLGRVGTTPSPQFLNTARAKLIAGSGDFTALEQRTARSLGKLMVSS